MNLLKDEKYLTEDYRVGDLFELGDEVHNLDSYITHSPDKSLIGFVGDYGKGKSTILFQLAQAHDEQSWFFFDAWKYPDRNSLWEGFILDFADEYGNQDKVIRNIEGKNSKGETVFAGFVKSIFATLSKVPVAPNIESLVGSVIDVFSPSPATRVFQLQKLLEGLVDSQAKPIVIVVEDIDRSGDKGVYFLETLNYFLKNTNLSNSIKVVVPMSSPNDENVKASYQKSLDFTTYFKPQIKDMRKFVIHTFHADLFDPEKVTKPTEERLVNTQAELIQQLTSFLVEVINDIGSPRLLKSLLREWKLNFERHTAAGHNPDYRVELAIQASKYLSNPGVNFEHMQVGAKLNRDTLLGTYLGAIYATRTEIRDINNNFQRHTNLVEFRFVNDPDYNVPKTVRASGPNGFENYFAISSWYLM